MANKAVFRQMISSPTRKPFSGVPFAEASTKCGLARSRLHRELNLLRRLTDLFSKTNPPYALNGSAALHLIFLGERTPSDIDLRCDDVEATRKLFSNRFEQVQRATTTVPLYSFKDENGVLIDITQNLFTRTRKHFIASPTASNLFTNDSSRVVSYDFEVLFAEKLIALTRKRDFKDLYDADSCLSHDADIARVAITLKEIGKHDGINPSFLISPLYVLDGGLCGDVPVSYTTANEMLSRVQAFVRSIF